MAASRMRLSSSMSRAFGWLVVIAALALAADEAHGQVPEAPAVVVQQLGEYPVGAQAEFPARVEAIEAVDVRARVQGVLEDIAFTAGERVEAGDILFRIERDQFEAGVASAHAQAARATANLTEAQAALERTRELHQRGTAAQAALDAAVAAHAMAEAEVASSKAAVRRAEIDLGYTEIRAAIAGRIASSVSIVMSPTRSMRARSIPSRRRFASAAASVVQRMSAAWSVRIRFISSGMLRSPLRSPASRCASRTPRCIAAIAAASVALTYLRNEEAAAGITDASRATKPQWGTRAP